MKSAGFFIKNIAVAPPIMGGGLYAPSKWGRYKASIPRRLAVFLTAFFMLLALMPAAGLAAQPEVGAFTKVEGRVDVLRDMAQGATAVKAGDAVYLGDIVRTKTGGRAEITFKDQSVLSIAPGSRLKIDQYVLNDDNTRKKAEVSLFRGKIRAVVTKAKETVIPVSSIEGSTFNINTPTAVAGIRGTELFVFFTNGVTGVVFTSGHGFVYNTNAPGQFVNVSAGFATLITSHDAPPTKPRPASDREIRQLINDTAVTNANGDKDGGATVDVFGYTSPDTDGGNAPPPDGDTTTSDMSGVVTVTDFAPELLGDIRPPEMFLAAAPASYTNQNSATFVITLNEPATLTYTVNNVVIQSGSLTTQDTFNMLGLPEGPYLLTVSAMDAAGNKSTFSFGWTTDYTPPVSSIASAPLALTNSSIFGFTANEPIAYYSYSLDGGVTWVSTGPSLTLSTAPEGGNTIQVKSTDLAGNASVGFSSYSWTTDYTAPAALALTGTPAAATNVNGATISATATDVNPITYSYTLDGAPSTEILTGLTEGLHTFAATATDAAGNTSAPVSYQWFYGARQYDMTGLASDLTGASTLSVASMGNLNLISTGTQGAWQLDFSGPYTGTPSTSVVAGGKAYDSTPALNGYWIDRLNLAAGTSSLAYLSKTAYGTGVGTVIGGYDGLGGFSATDTGLGTYTETPLDFSGDVWGGLLWYDPVSARLVYANAFDGFGYPQTPNVNGFIGLVGNLWTTGAAQARLMGDYTTGSGAEPYLIYGSGWYMSYDPTVVGYSTALGGAFNGYNVGVWSNGVTKSNAVAIYIDPSGKAGYLKGVLDGAYYTGLGIWEMNGTLATTFKETTAILPADLEFSLTTGHYGHYGQWGAGMSGSFATTNGMISAAYVEGSLKGLTGHNWGIWNGGMGGNYDTTNSSASFTAAVGASGFMYDGWSGIMLGSMTSADWGVAGNGFTGNLSTQFITPFLLGTMTSEGLYGTFDPATGNWQSSMVGTWQATPLKHYSEFWANAYSYGDPYGWGYIYGFYDGQFYGSLGGTDSLWASASTPVTLMGGSNTSMQSPHIYNVGFNSYNYLNNTGTTYDNGAYCGFAAGIEVNGAMETLLYALYVDDNNNAGYLKGGLGGTHYPSIGVFEQTGNIAKFEKGQNAGITATDFINSIYYGWSGPGGSLSGASLSGNSDFLTTMTLVNTQTIIPQNWGIYSHTFTGQYANPAGNWTAKAGGYDAIGVANPFIEYAGVYSYANDNGYYSYSYNNGFGSQAYFRPSLGTGTGTDYASDGSTTIYNYAWGDPYLWGYSYWYSVSTSAGAPWDTSTSLSVLATSQPDSANATLSNTWSNLYGSNDAAYWLMDVNGQSWAGDRLTATVTGKFLSPYYMGTLTGDLLGIYDPVSGLWSANDVGIYEATPLAWSGDVSPDSNGAGLYSLDTWSYWLDVEGYSTGLMGGVASPWSGPTAVTYMGRYDVSLGIGYGPPYLWMPEIYSVNLNNWTVTTYDNGMYKGFVGGVWKGDGTIDANVYSLYIDPMGNGGNAGILKGSMTGAYYPAINMFEADGTWTPATLTTGLDATTATVNVVTYDYGYSISSSGAFNGAGSIWTNGSEMMGATDWRYSIAGQNWGVSKSIIGGEYAGPTSDAWSLDTVVDFSGFGGQIMIYGTMTDGSKWSADAGGNDVIKGQTYGYGADIAAAAPNTWISVGETLGTFDAVNLAWQAVQTSAWLETNKFLAMTQTVEGQAALTSLNIPFVEVGKANLAGSAAMGDGSVNVNMNNVTFFAYSNGAAPKIWATGDVNGGYTCMACGQASVVLAGNGLAANFNVNQFDTVTTQKWIATVNGGGAYSGTGTMNGSNVQMTGAAAGTINTGTSTFTGTGAGTAQ